VIQLEELVLIQVAAPIPQVAAPITQVAELHQGVASCIPISASCILISATCGNKVAELTSGHMIPVGFRKYMRWYALTLITMVA
jgi:hypothetical protein